MLTDVSLSTFEPAAGVCSMTLRGSALGSMRRSTGWLSLRSFSRRSFSAANESEAPTSDGTFVFCGHSSQMRSAMTAASKISPMSHSGTIGFWR